MAVHMTDFTIRFFLCNLALCILIGIFSAAKRLLKNSLTSRMQYRMWFGLLGLMTVPFWPFRAGGPARFSWFDKLDQFSLPSSEILAEETSAANASAAGWMNDFGVSVSQRTPSAVGIFLMFLWAAGILLMLGNAVKSLRRLDNIRKSSLPLQNPALRRLYQECLREMKLKRRIPVRSTAFLRSPMIAGFWRPCVYLPIHLITDWQEKDIRYMLLHELQHYKQRDALANYVMNIMGILYWFNPLVWYALREMRNDREIACDTRVLQMLPKEAYEDYGNTLLNFVEKISFTPFLFAAGIGGSMRQMTRRILNIAEYRPVSFRRKMRSAFAGFMLLILLLAAVPSMSIRAYNNDCYYFEEKGKRIVSLDLSDAFDGYDGCFVMYDMAEDTWLIYQKEAAITRIPPASTYKIYSALFGLESGAITPEQSTISWNGQFWPYEQWNRNQTLESAMRDSVTWYFQALDERTGLEEIDHYIREIGYGNQTVGRDVDSYWLDSSLKISPIEQVEMLRKLYDNQFGFDMENIKNVKESICLYDDGQTVVYGKTGTQETNGKNTSGWFIGYLEKDGRTCFFATNIQKEDSATGPAAADLTFSILSGSAGGL